MAGKPQKDPNQVAQKWVRNLGSAQQSMKDGVMGVTTAPTQLAAQKSAQYAQGVQDAVNSGKWQAGLRRVDLPAWQQAYITKGLPRVASGAQQAQGKMAAFQQQWLPAAAAISAQIAQMPSGGEQNAIARSAAAISAAMKFKRS